MTASARIFRHGIRVPYAHVDQMGVVYYANYLVYFEMARSEMLREAGTPYTELEKKGVRLPVVEAFCEYLAPAHYDDWLIVESRVPGIQGARLRIEYVIRRDEKPMVTGHTIHVCVNPQGKVLRPVEEFRRLTGKDPI